MDGHNRIDDAEHIMGFQESPHRGSEDEKHIVNNDATSDNCQQQHGHCKYDVSWPSNPLETSNQIPDAQFYTDTLPLQPSSNAEVEPPPPANRCIYRLQTKPGYGVKIAPYNLEWPVQFLSIQSHLHNLFTTASPPVPYTKIEHIGSTSIPGLAAKPNIDILVTLPSHEVLELAIEALDWEIPSAPPFTRYTRVRNGGGIQGRESFKLHVPEWSPYYHCTPERSVYLIDESEGNYAGKVQIRCYRSVRETLRDPQNEDLLKEYAQVKIDLGQRIYENSITYSALKNDMIRKVLKRAGWTEQEVDEKERLSERVWEAEEPPY